MNFINVDNTIAAVAGGLASAIGEAKEAEGERVSHAAALLHRELFNAVVEPPRWVEVSDTTGQPLFRDEIRREGLAMLESVAGWAKRLREETVRYLMECALMGVEPDEVKHPKKHNPRDGKYGAARFWRERRIGFNLPDLVRFLDAAGMKHSLDRACPPEGSAGGDDSQSVPLTEHQEQASSEKGLTIREQQIRTIIAAARAAGYDPLSIPTGGKTVLRNACKENHPKLFWGKHSFDGAWSEAGPERLRMEKQEIYAGGRQGKKPSAVGPVG